MARVGHRAYNACMSETYVITFQVRPEHRGRFLTLLGAVLDAMRHETTFVQAALHEDPEDPNRFMLYETWQDRDDVLTVQLQRPYRAAWHAALDEILAQPRDIQIWRPLRADVR